MGLSFLVPKEARALTVTVRWGDYTPAEIEGEDGKPVSVWQRQPREATVAVALTGRQRPGGARRARLRRPPAPRRRAADLRRGSRRRTSRRARARSRSSSSTTAPPDEDEPDLAYVFQPEIEVRSDQPFVPRPDLRGAQAEEWDEQVADLHYADTPEYATGHGVSAEWEIVDGACRAAPHRVDPERRGREDGDRGRRRASSSRWRRSGRSPMAPRPRRRCGRSWRSTATGSRRSEPSIATLAGTRRETAEELLRLAGIAADRIERGIDVAGDGRGRPRCLPRGEPRGRAGAQQAARHRDAALARLPARLHPAQSPGPRRPARSEPRDGGPALLPDGRRQDRGVPRPRGLRDGAAPAAPSRARRGSRAPA